MSNQQSSVSDLVVLTVADIEDLTAAELAALGALEISELGAANIPDIPVAAMPGLTQAEASGLTAAEVAALDAAQVAALTTSAITGLGTTGMAALSYSAIAGLTAAQAGVLSAAQVAILTPGQVGALSPAAIGGLSPNVISSFSAADVAALPAASVAALTLPQLSMFSSSQLQALGTAGVSALTTADLNGLTATQVSELTPAQLSALNYARLTEASNLTFDDEFNTFVSSPNGSVGWMTSYPYGGENARALPANGEAEYYSDSSVGTNPFSDTNGVLDITATVAAPGSNPYGLPYTSGLITTYQSLAQTYGYFEIRAELPAGQGLWPAFWLLPTQPNYTSELDVFEVLGNAPTTLYSTAHTEVGGVWSAVTDTLAVANTSTGFNTYGVDWEPTTLTFYMNGQVIATMPTPATMNSPMYMLVDLAVGAAGSWPGAPSSSSEFPSTLQVDYVRAYATANTIEVSGTDAIATAGITGTLLVGSAGWAGATVSLETTGGYVLQTTTTNSSGSFSFSGLAAGNYQVQYTTATGLALQSGGPANVSTGLTSTLTLTDNQTLNLGAQSLVAPSDPASIQSNVLHFFGATDPSYGGADAGVVVTLLNASGVAIASTVTDSNGWFIFRNLAAGTYQLDYTPPSGQVIDPGTPVSTSTDLTTPFTVAAGQNLWAQGAWMVTLASVAGSVTASGAGQAGVTVLLLNGAGTVVGTTTTNSSGAYSFSNLTPGNYQVEFTAPNGMVLQTGSEAVSTTGLTPVFALSYSQSLTLPTEQLLSNPASVQSDVLHFGGPTDPVYGGADPGASVSLLNAAGTVIATTVTNSGGWFIFRDLAPGTYQLLYTPPVNQEAKSGSAANLTTNLTAPFTITAGQNLFAGDGYMVSVGTIAGSVAMSGSAEAGVTVTLLNASNAVVATTTTNSAGAFSFAQLATGTYEVKYTAPSGLMLVSGSEANSTTGLTPALTLTAGQTLTLPVEQLQTATGIIQSNVLHFGGATDPVYGGGDGGATVSLVNSGGQVIASTVSNSGGWFEFTNVVAGTYQLEYTPPAGQAIKPNSPVNPTTDLTASFTLAPGQNLVATGGQMISEFAMNGTAQTATEGAGSYTVTGNASDSSLILGAGNQTVTLTGGGNTVTTGAGNQAITLSGSGNTITVGAGNSTINAGSGNAVVHAGGGDNTIIAAGGGNLLDGGPGISFLKADGSAGNTFVTNVGGSANLTTITGFNIGDVLDLQRTLAGTSIAADLSNIGNFITAKVSGSTTTLYVDPTGGSGTATAFAVLSGFQTSMSQLEAAHVFSMT